MDRGMSAGILQFKVTVYDTPILAFANYSKLFKVHTDASGLGLNRWCTNLNEGHPNKTPYASTKPNRMVCKESLVMQAELTVRVKRNIQLTTWRFLH